MLPGQKFPPVPQRDLLANARTQPTDFPDEATLDVEVHSPLDPRSPIRILAGIRSFPYWNGFVHFLAFFDKNVNVTVSVGGRPERFTRAAFKRASKKAFIFRVFLTYEHSPPLCIACGQP